MKVRMNRFLKLLSIVFLLFLCTGCPGGTGVRKMTMEEAQKEIEAGDKDFLIVDVRTQEEYDKGHIPGAILVPIEDIREGKLDRIPDKEQKMMIYCWTGRRSEDSAAILAKEGYTNLYDIGGYIDWKGESEGSHMDD